MTTMAVAEQVGEGGFGRPAARGDAGSEAGVRSERTDASPRGARRATSRPIPVRAMGFPFDASIPRAWFHGNAVATHVANGLNLLFPEGERFFIRSVKHYLDQLGDDPELAARVRAFFGQEGRHGHEHERFNRILEAQGYEVARFLTSYKHWAFEVCEPRVSPALRLSITAALEHYTATLADNGLRSDVMDSAHPVLRDLLKWHAAEEIEHKSVAFDVLRKVDPRWSLRVSGMLLATLGLMTFWAIASRDLLAQERARGTDLRAAARAAGSDPKLIAEGARRRALLRGAFVDYLRPSFHPDQHDNYDLARAYLASIGRLDH